MSLELDPPTRRTLFWKCAGTLGKPKSRIVELELSFQVISLVPFVKTLYSSGHFNQEKVRSLPFSGSDPVLLLNAHMNSHLRVECQRLAFKKGNYAAIMRVFFKTPNDPRLDYGSDARVVWRDARAGIGC